MSKNDELRRMREARYARDAARAGATVARPRTAAPPVAPASKTAGGAAATAAPTSEPDDGLCGHRSINGRTCTREHGHSAKNHRYS